MKIINNKALKFALYILPAGIIAAILTTSYVLSTYDEALVEQILAQTNKTAFILMIILQVGIIYTGLLGYFGYILADEVNLIKKLSFDKRITLLTLAISAACGLLLLSDYFTFAKIIPEVAASYTKESFSMMNLIFSAFSITKTKWA